MGITPIMWAPYSITLGTGPVSMARNHNDNWLLIFISPHPFYWWQHCWNWLAGLTSLANDHGRWGWHRHSFFFQLSEELGQISGHRFINNLLKHPPPLSNSLMPFQNHTVTRYHFSHGYNNITSKYIQFDMFHIYLIKYNYRYCINIMNSFNMIDIPINIFLFVSFPFG